MLIGHYSKQRARQVFPGQPSSFCLLFGALRFNSSVMTFYPFFVYIFVEKCILSGVLMRSKKNHSLLSPECCMVLIADVKLN